MEIPVPKIGYPVSLLLAREKKVFFHSPLSILSLPTSFDIPLRLLFELITVENILKIILSMLSEQKIIFLSFKKSLLSFTIQSFCTLLYPFAWHHALVPILPKILIDFLHSPMPFIMGVEKSNFTQNFRSILKVIYLIHTS
jgi:hypothetical protein